MKILFYSSVEKDKITFSCENYAFLFKSFKCYFDQNGEKTEIMSPSFFLLF